MYSMYAYKYSVDIIYLLRLGLGGVLVICEEVLTLDIMVAVVQFPPPPPF